jgi:magnesium chelatase family protein
MRIASPLTTEAHPVLQWIEVASSLQLPSFHIIGLASPEVAEARERVRAAIECSDFEFPRRRVVINLSPASIRKRGTGADLAMAIGILQTGLSEDDESFSRFPRGIVASGELGLDGRVKPAGKVMRTLYAAWEAGAEIVFLSPEDHEQALKYLPLLERLERFRTLMPRLVSVASLTEAWDFVLGNDLSNETQAVLPRNSSLFSSSSLDAEDLLPLSPEIEKWVRIAALGLHHLLLLGPRGAGKSHAFEWLIKLQPEASAETQVRQILIRELSGLENEWLGSGPPVRRVGTQVRAQALCGGVVAGGVRPGEFSLAHGGLLIADELPEWPRDSRESLREPLERGKISLTRTQATAELPARFILAANGNLCPCGGWPRLLRIGHEGTQAKRFPCICKDSEVSTYLRKLSGPVLDRIDIIQLVTPSARESLTSCGEQNAQENFKRFRDRTAEAQSLGEKTWGVPPGLLGPSEIEAILKEHPDWREALNRRKNVGMRSRHKIVRVALSLALFERVESQSRGSELPLPTERHFEEAFYLRPEGINLHGQPNQ